MTDATENDGQKPAGTTGVLVQVKRLAIQTRAGKTLLSDVSFHIEPGELIALTGLSRSGKSALLRSLAGLMKPESGEILLDGISLYANLKAFRPTIGFVPAEYALQQNLTVAEVMREAARLLLPRRVSSQDRQQRVQALLQTVGLTQVEDRRIGVLSRAEKRRLSIALELIPSPSLLLLDESAEQLTPFEEVQITILLRELSRQGLTIIQTDRRARSAGLSDKIIFLAPGGLLAWFGPPDEAFIYLRGFVPGGIVKDLFGLKEALEVLANPQLQEGVEWAKRFKAHSAYQKYVDDPLDNRYPDLMLQTHPLLRLRLRNSSKEKLPPPIVPRASNIQKFFLLMIRNLRLLWRDKTALFMFIIPPVIALIDWVFASTTKSNPNLAQVTFGLLVFLALITAALLVQNEVSKERAVYHRESRTSSMSFAYILSKVWLVGILAVYQGLVWAIIHFAATGIQILSVDAITLILVTFIGGILGLIVSALSRTATATANWLMLLTVPQLILSGSLVPTASLSFPFNFLSGLNPSRYAFEVLFAASGSAQGLNVIPLNHWLILFIMSFCLIVLLLGIQQRSGSPRVNY